MTDTSVDKKEYDEMVKELESVTEQLTKTREDLWKSQDEVKERQDKIETLESHVAELVTARENDASMIQSLRGANTSSLEEEMKLRESMDLMKKVFARTQLKSKEEQETFQLMRQERDLLLEENKLLRTGFSTKDTKAIDRTVERERALTERLEDTKKELALHKSKLRVANENIKIMSKKLFEAGDANAAHRQIVKQQTKIDYLERQLLAMQEESPRSDMTILQRGFIDEDLEESVVRQMLKRLDCSSTGCSDGLEEAYAFMGVDQFPPAKAY